MKALGSAIFALCATVWAISQSQEVALRQIVLASEQEAREVLGLITRDSFEAIASQRSRDATAQRGGYVGRVRLSDLRSDVRVALEMLKPGEVSNPIRIGNTFVLFQII